MLDMGPYYLTALVNLLGPVRRVTGSARISFPERTITSEKKRGKKIGVETPTHLAGVADFADGAVGTIIMSFDGEAHELPGIEVYGSEGTLSVPDPNGFGGVGGVLSTFVRGVVVVSHHAAAARDGSGGPARRPSRGPAGEGVSRGGQPQRLQCRCREWPVRLHGGGGVSTMGS